MKKCPKCNTILDDSKKKCYMCGADLQTSKNNVDFLNRFDDQIGATITKSQDNVFNNVSNISAKIEQVANKNESNATFSKGISSADFYQNQLNSLNSMQYDDRNPIEKMFSNNSEFKSKDEINAEEAMKKNKVKENVSNVPNKNKNVKVEQQTVKPIVPVQSNDSDFSPGAQKKTVIQQPAVKAPEPVKKKKDKEVQKPSINWGNNLSQNDNSHKKINFGNEKKFSLNFVLNIVCAVIFVFLMIFVYFKYIRGDNSIVEVQLGDLTYEVSKDFSLENNNSDKDDSYYYMYGDNCALRVTYGTEAASDFLNSYFDNIKEKYSVDNGYFAQKGTLLINNNEWTEITVSEISDNPAAESGYSRNVKYRFVTVLHNKKYYEIKYVNEDGDNKCTEMYHDLIDSLKFN